jgi:Transcriptional regulator, AbiEi antitoxin, Type IV TA system
MGTGARGAAAERRAADATFELLSELIGSAHWVHRPGSRADKTDFVVGAGEWDFAVELKATGAAGPVSRAAEAARRYRGPREVPLVVVPFMGPTGRRICADRGVSWLDLSGNAHITAKGLLVHVEGKPNAYKRVGRPASVFSPAASRISRRLLTNPSTPFSQRELARLDALDEGHVSRTVARLVELGYVRRDASGVRVVDPALLLDAWREEYDFSRHRIVRAHAPARSSEALVQELAHKLPSLQHDHAATGLAGAWLTTGFAGFRLVTFFVSDASDRIVEELGLRKVDKGENVWLVEPDDVGVLIPPVEIDGIACVHPVQLYLDLKGHPERSIEAAESVKRAYLEEIRRG